MNLVCALFGHQPVPLVSRRQLGRWVNHCVVCQRPIVHLDRQWHLMEEGEIDFPSSSNGR